MENTATTTPKVMIQINNSDLFMDEVPTNETEKAIYVRVLNRVCGSNKMFWIPKSVITFKEKSVEMPLWFYSKNFGYIK